MPSLPCRADEIALVADELPVAIWMGRVPSGEVVYTNRCFREVLGIEPPEGAARGAFVEPYGVHTLDGAPYPEDRMPFERAIAARTTVVIDDIVIHRRDGRRVHLRVFAKPLFDDDGTMTHVLEAFTDITREVEAERARADGERRLARAQRLESVGQLVAGIAHDFNNLLTVTKLVVSRMRADEGDDKRRESLAMVEAVTDSGVGLIRNLIAFARRGVAAPSPVPLEEVVGSIADIARRTFDRAIVVRTELGAAGAWLLGDRAELEQVIMNLALNARDAIEGEGEIVLRTSVGEGSTVVLEVADTGCGIAPEIRERVFEPYFTTKTWGPVKGTGLGLSTVYGIVHGHGGSVELLDNAPRGTIVRVTLPSAIDAARERREAPADPVSLRGAGRVVLVVDDERLVREQTVAALRALGFAPLEAHDGLSALDLFRAHENDVAVVLLDLIMPGMGGREVCRRMLELRPDVPVVIVTGTAPEEHERTGARAVLPKPYGDVELARCLRDVLAPRR